MPKLKHVVPTDAPKQLQLNAGVIATGMTIESIQSAITEGVLEIPQANILGLTSGGLSISCEPQFIDLGEDIDYLKGKVKECQYVSGYDTSISGTLVTASEAQVKMMVGNADMKEANGLTTITAKEGFIDESAFTTLHVIGEQGADAIWIVELNNAFNTGGFSKTTTDKEKSTFDVEFSGHYDIADIQKCPMTFYTLKDAVSQASETQADTKAEPTE